MGVTVVLFFSSLFLTPVLHHLLPLHLLISLLHLDLLIRHPHLYLRVSSSLPPSLPLHLPPSPYLHLLVSPSLPPSPPPSFPLHLPPSLYTSIPPSPYLHLLVLTLNLFVLTCMMAETLKIILHSPLFALNPNTSISPPLAMPALSMVPYKRDEPKDPNLDPAATRPITFAHSA